MKMYSVWVGGGEVNDYYLLDRDEAERIAERWRDKGYDDVVVDEIDLGDDDEPDEKDIAETLERITDNWEGWHDSCSIK